MRAEYPNQLDYSGAGYHTYAVPNASASRERAETRNRTGNLQTISLTLSQLSYRCLLGGLLRTVAFQKAAFAKLRGRELNPGLPRDGRKY